MAAETSKQNVDRILDCMKWQRLELDLGIKFIFNLEICPYRKKILFSFVRVEFIIFIFHTYNFFYTMLEQCVHLSFVVNIKSLFTLERLAEMDRIGIRRK